MTEVTIDRPLDWAALTQTASARPLSQSPDDYTFGILAVLEAVLSLVARTGLVASEGRYIPDAVDADGRECDVVRDEGVRFSLRGAVYRAAQARGPDGYAVLMKRQGRVAVSHGAGRSA